MADRSVVRREVGALVSETGARVGLVAKATGLLWAVEVVNSLLLQGWLVNFGIQSRTLAGLVGILFAPFLHAGFGHLIANTVPFAILGFLVTARKRMDFWVVTAVTALTSGLGAWLFAGAGTVTVGASGVIMGYLGFLMGRGIFERRVGTAILSLAVTFLFGGMLWGVLPIVAGAGISWQAHLFGWLGGLFTARVLGKALQKKGR